jgi:hypothetical protein
MPALDELCILRDWRGHLVPRSLEAVALWLDQNRGPADKPEGEDNTPNLIWLATPSENASGVGHPKFSRGKGFDIAFTHGAFFDVDGPASTENAFAASVAALERVGYGAVYSRSHSAYEVDPWRGHVQLVFDSPCPAHVHARVWKQLHREFFPLVQRSQHSPVRGRNAPKPGAKIEVLPGNLVDWRAVLERAPEDVTEPVFPHVTTSVVQLSEHDAEIADSLAALWQPRTTGERAFGAFAGWLYRRGVSRERALGIAARVSQLSGAVGGHAERRVNQAYDGGCPLGRPALLEALGQDGGRRLGGGSGLAAPEVLVACELDRLEDLIAESTRETPEPKHEPSPGADPFSAWGDVLIDDRSRTIMLATRVPRRETGDWSAPPQEPAWVCKGLLLCPEARAHIVAAYPNGGKTWFVTELGRAVSTGTPFGGSFPTPKGRVLGLEFEEDRHEHNEKRQMLSLPVSSPLASPDWVVLHAGDPELRALIDWDAIFGVQRGRDGVRFIDQDEDLAPLVALIDGFDLVTIDSLRSVSGSFDENTKFASRPLQRFRRAAQLCRHTFPTVVVIHHASKSSLKSEIRRSQHGQPSKDFRGLTSGTTALEGDAGNIWLLDPDPSEDFLTHVHHARKSRGPKQASFAVRQTYGLAEPASPVDLPRPVTQYQIETAPNGDAPPERAHARDVTDEDVIREVLRYLYRARAVHDGECRSIKALTPSVAAQLDPSRGSVESRALRPMKPAALARLIEQAVRANEGRLCQSQHEPGALEGQPLIGTLRLRAGSSRPGWWLQLEGAAACSPELRDGAREVSLALPSPIRPGSPEARADALHAQLAGVRGVASRAPLGLVYLPAEYDRPKKALSPARKTALKLLEARGIHVLRVPGFERAFLVDLAVARRFPWVVRRLGLPS